MNNIIVNIQLLSVIADDGKYITFANNAGLVEFLSSVLSYAGFLRLTELKVCIFKVNHKDWDTALLNHQHNKALS